MSVPVRRWPIAARLLLSALVLVLLLLPVSGGLLAWNFREAVNDSFNDRLEFLQDMVIAGIEFRPETQTLAPGPQLSDPRFERVYSGWYWQVSSAGMDTVTSRSLWDQRLPVAIDESLHWQTMTGPREQALRAVTRRVQLPSYQEPIYVTVAGDLTEVNQQVARFQTLLIVSLVTLAVLLLAMIALQIRWGLAPLRRLEKSLRAVESGHRQTLDIDFPEELARLARATNQVLARDQRLIERGRTTAGNLAHALKTPVAVLSGLCEQLPEAQQSAFRAELARLNDAVRHHLARASAAGPSAMGGGVQANEALQPVLAALSTLAERRSIEFTRTIEVSGPVPFEEQDLQELVGNLVENALNWAEHRVFLSITGDNHQALVLTVDDDGPGMTEENINRALERGGRLDEARSGSGLGLAIVNDLVQLYAGKLQLQTSPDLGGLQVRAEFSKP
ncbi:MAG: HAMP domain-containing histidine kinase [Alteromonadaceae bacterium]|nr:HAMP domain-containing histidine kinase [Alteromonadaceae bacterium]